MKLNVDMIVL